MLKNYQILTFLFVGIILLDICIDLYCYTCRNEKKKNTRQTFVFSATLTLVHSGPQRSSRKKMALTEEKKLGMGFWNLLFIDENKYMY